LGKKHWFLKPLKKKEPSKTIENRGPLREPLEKRDVWHGVVPRHQELLIGIAGGGPLRVG